MTGSWQEIAALVVVAGAVYFLYRHFRPRDDARPLVKPRGRLARGIEAAKRNEDERR